MHLSFCEIEITYLLIVLPRVSRCGRLSRLLVSWLYFVPAWW